MKSRQGIKCPKHSRGEDNLKHSGAHDFDVPKKPNCRKVSGRQVWTQTILT